MVMFLTYLYHGCRWGLGLLFCYAGITKLLAPKIFSTVIEAYGLLPDFLVFPTAVILPMLELLGGLALLADVKGSLGLILVMATLFVGILSYGLWLGLDIDCGCFGSEGLEIHAFYSMRAARYKNLAVIGIISFMYWWRRHRRIRPIAISSMINKLLIKRR